MLQREQQAAQLNGPSWGSSSPYLARLPVPTRAGGGGPPRPHALLRGPPKGHRGPSPPVKSLLRPPPAAAASPSDFAEEFPHHSPPPTGLAHPTVFGPRTRSASRPLSGASQRGPFLGSPLPGGSLLRNSRSCTRLEGPPLGLRSAHSLPPPLMEKQGSKSGVAGAAAEASAAGETPEGGEVQLEGLEEVQLLLQRIRRASLQLQGGGARFGPRAPDRPKTGRPPTQGPLGARLNQSNSYGSAQAKYTHAKRSPYGSLENLRRLSRRSSSSSSSWQQQEQQPKAAGLPYHPMLTEAGLLSSASAAAEVQQHQHLLPAGRRASRERSPPSSLYSRQQTPQNPQALWTQPRYSRRPIPQTQFAPAHPSLSQQQQQQQQQQEQPQQGQQQLGMRQQQPQQQPCSFPLPGFPFQLHQTNSPWNVRAAEQQQPQQQHQRQQQQQQQQTLGAPMGAAEEVPYEGEGTQRPSLASEISSGGPCCSVIERLLCSSSSDPVSQSAPCTSSSSRNSPTASAEATQAAEGPATAPAAAAAALHSRSETSAAARESQDEANGSLDAAGTDEQSDSLDEDPQEEQEQQEQHKQQQQQQEAPVVERTSESPQALQQNGAQKGPRALQRFIRLKPSSSLQASLQRTSSATCLGLPWGWGGRAAATKEGQLFSTSHASNEDWRSLLPGSRMGAEGSQEEWSRTSGSSSNSNSSKHCMHSLRLQLSCLHQEVLSLWRQRDSSPQQPQQQLQKLQQQEQPLEEQQQQQQRQTPLLARRASKGGLRNLQHQGTSSFLWRRHRGPFGEAASGVAHALRSSWEGSPYILEPATDGAATLSAAEMIARIVSSESVSGKEHNKPHGSLVPYGHLHTAVRARIRLSKKADLPPPTQQQQQQQHGQQMHQQQHQEQRCQPPAAQARVSSPQSLQEAQLQGINGATQQLRQLQQQLQRVRSMQSLHGGEGLPQGALGMASPEASSVKAGRAAEQSSKLAFAEASTLDELSSKSSLELRRSSSSSSSSADMSFADALQLIDSLVNFTHMQRQQQHQRGESFNGQTLLDMGGDPDIRAQGSPASTVHTGQQQMHPDTGAPNNKGPQTLTPPSPQDKETGASSIPGAPKWASSQQGLHHINREGPPTLLCDSSEAWSQASSLTKAQLLNSNSISNSSCSSSSSTYAAAATASAASPHAGALSNATCSKRDRDEAPSSPPRTFGSELLHGRAPPPTRALVLPPPPQGPLLAADNLKGKISFSRLGLGDQDTDLLNRVGGGGVEIVTRILNELGEQRRPFVAAAENDLYNNNNSNSNSSSSSSSNRSSSHEMLRHRKQHRRQRVARKHMRASVSLSELAAAAAAAEALAAASKVSEAPGGPHGGPSRGGRHGGLYVSEFGLRGSHRGWCSALWGGAEEAVLLPFHPFAQKQQLRKSTAPRCSRRQRRRRDRCRSSSPPHAAATVDTATQHDGALPVPGEATGRPSESTGVQADVAENASPQPILQDKGTSTPTDREDKRSSNSSEGRSANGERQTITFPPTRRPTASGAAQREPNNSNTSSSSSSSDAAVAWGLTPCTSAAAARAAPTTPSDSLSAEDAANLAFAQWVNSQGLRLQLLPDESETQVDPWCKRKEEGAQHLSQAEHTCTEVESLCDDQSHTSSKGRSVSSSSSRSSSSDSNSSSRTASSNSSRRSAGRELASLKGSSTAAKLLDAVEGSSVRHASARSRSVSTRRSSRGRTASSSTSSSSSSASSSRDSSPSRSRGQSRRGRSITDTPLSQQHQQEQDAAAAGAAAVSAFSSERGRTQEVQQEQREVGSIRRGSSRLDLLLQRQKRVRCSSSSWGVWRQPSRSGGMHSSQQLLKATAGVWQRLRRFAQFVRRMGIDPSRRVFCVETSKHKRGLFAADAAAAAAGAAAVAAGAASAAGGGGEPTYLQEPRLTVESCVLHALKAWGWAANQDLSSQFFDLKWRLRASKREYRELKPQQLLNHFEGNEALTTKGGLTRSLQQLNVSERVCTEAFYPRAYDLGVLSDCTAFLLDCCRCEALQVLLVYLKHTLPSKTRPTSPAAAAATAAAAAAPAADFPAADVPGKDTQPAHVSTSKLKGRSSRSRSQPEVKLLYAREALLLPWLALEVLEAWLPELDPDAFLDCTTHRFPHALPPSHVESFVEYSWLLRKHEALYVKHWRQQSQHRQQQKEWLEMPQLHVIPDFEIKPIGPDCAAVQNLLRRIRALWPMWPHDVGANPHVDRLLGLSPQQHKQQQPKQQQQKQQQQHQQEEGEDDWRLRNIWIVKPCSNARASGIKLCTSPLEILKSGRGLRDRLAQRYIERPLLLWGRRKFDLRVWVLVRSFSPLEVYLYSEVYARLCTEAYDRNDLCNHFKHISNWSLNRLQAGKHGARGSQALGAPSHQDAASADKEGPPAEATPFASRPPAANDITTTNNSSSSGKVADEDRGFSGAGETTLPLETLRSALAEKTGNPSYWEEELLPQLRFLVLQTMRAARQSVVQRSSCFELYGLDVLLDEALRPWLLEVNLSPACSTRQPWLRRLLTRMTEQLLEIVLSEDCCSNGARACTGGGPGPPHEEEAKGAPLAPAEGSQSRDPAKRKESSKPQEGGYWELLFNEQLPLETALSVLPRIAAPCNAGPTSLTREGEPTAAAFRSIVKELYAGGGPAAAAATAAAAAGAGPRRCTGQSHGLSVVGRRLKH
ncbi:hypothetical protein ACSSS7_004385 [Eimeria intestinalis]